MPGDIIDQTSDVDYVPPGFEFKTVPTRLVTQQKLHTSCRIHLVFDILADTFTNSG